MSCSELSFNQVSKAGSEEWKTMSFAVSVNSVGPKLFLKCWFVFDFNIVLWFMCIFQEKAPYFAKVGKMKEEYEKIKRAYNANAEKKKEEDYEEIIRAYNVRLVITLILSFYYKSKHLMFLQVKVCINDEEVDDIRFILLIVGFVFDFIDLFMFFR